MEVTREAGMINPTTRTIGRTSNSKSVARRGIWRPPVPRLKSMKKMMTIAQIPPVVERE